jgi:Tfp pilus assembly protein FimT
MRRLPRHSERGITVLEMLVVLAIIVMLVYALSRGYRRITKADLVDDSIELAKTLRKTSTLAIETGQLHRVVLNFETNAYMVEVCSGTATVTRGKDANKIEDPREVQAKVQGKLEDAKRRLNTGGAAGASTQVAPPNAEDAARAAAAIAGHHVLDQMCEPAIEDPSPDKRDKELRGTPIRKLNAESEVKLKEIWVQHTDESVTSGTAVIYFFPFGSAEKAIVELSSGSDTFSILVYGLTGRVELLDGPYTKPEEHMMRDLEGNKEVERD